MKTGTEIGVNKAELIKLFENHLKGDNESLNAIQKNIHPSTNTQYQRGI